MYATGNAPVKPHGLLKWAFSLPRYLYRWHLGWLLGHQCLMITHLGRKTGRRWQTVLEVVQYDPKTLECVVVASYGVQTDWYRNIQAHPALLVQVGGRRYVPRQRMLLSEETLAMFEEYQQRHPVRFRKFLRLVGHQYDGTPEGLRALAVLIPGIAFSPKEPISGNRTDTDRYTSNVNGRQQGARSPSVWWNKETVMEHDFTHGNHIGDIWGEPHLERLPQAAHTVSEGDTHVCVFGSSPSNIGVWGQSQSNDGVFGTSDSGVAIHGQGVNLAGLFEGNVQVTGDIILTNADCAEEFDVAAAGETEPGTVMVVDEHGALQPSQQAYDKKVVGVISGAGDYQPRLILDKKESSERRIPLALVGKVYCKADAQYAIIEVGDLLTTSHSPGHAMEASDPVQAFGAIIGWEKS